MKAHETVVTPVLTVRNAEAAVAFSCPLPAARDWARAQRD